MGNDFLLNAGIPSSAIHLEPASSLQMPSWGSFSSAMEIQPNQLNCSSEQSSECFFNANWERSTDHSLHFDSALSSMVSSPALSNSNISNESFVIRELIGKLGNIGNSGEISPHSFASFMNNGNSSANTGTTSCYTTPLNSPPKLNLPIMDHLVKEKLPSFGNSTTLNSNVAEFSADPGFAERAARFSRFGSRSFNGRTSQFAPNNPEFGFRSNPLTANGKLMKLPRVSSSPSLKVLGSQAQAHGVHRNKNSPLQNRSELANSQEESSVSEQVHNGDVVGSKTVNDFNSKKRKAVSKGKGKEPAACPSANNTKVAESNDNCNSNNKRCKPNEGSPEEEAKNAEDDKQAKTNTKPPEPPKDYIHVRARRGQATDSHSLAERVRREKISERMKLLQDLVPGCNKVTGKALMLDEIINYVQSLQRQVEFLSMKLASVNTRLDFNVDALMSKDAIYPTNKPLPHTIFQLDSSASAFFSHQAQQNPAALPFNNSTLCQNLNMQMQLPQLEQFPDRLLPPQCTNFCEDDLQSIVQMGFGNNQNGEASVQSHGPNQASHMKIEL